MINVRSATASFANLPSFEGCRKSRFDVPIRKTGFDGDLCDRLGHRIHPAECVLTRGVCPEQTRTQQGWVIGVDRHLHTRSSELLYRVIQNGNYSPEPCWMWGKSQGEFVGQTVPLPKTPCLCTAPLARSRGAYFRLAV